MLLGDAQGIIKIYIQSPLFKWNKYLSSLLKCQNIGGNATALKTAPFISVYVNSSMNVRKNDPTMNIKHTPEIRLMIFCKSR